MATVRSAVQREHRRADDQGSREPRIIDGERFAVPHHPQREIVAGHQPAAQHGQPGDRLILSQPPQQHMRVAVQFGDSRRGSQREPAAAVPGVAAAGRGDAGRAHAWWPDAGRGDAGRAAAGRADAGGSRSGTAVAEDPWARRLPPRGHRLESLHALTIRTTADGTFATSPPVRLVCQGRIAEPGNALP